MMLMLLLSLYNYAYRPTKRESRRDRFWLLLQIDLFQIKSRKSFGRSGSKAVSWDLCMRVTVSLRCSEKTVFSSFCANNRQSIYKKKENTDILSDIHLCTNDSIFCQFRWLLYCGGGSGYSHHHNSLFSFFWGRRRGRKKHANWYRCDDVS